MSPPAPYSTESTEARDGNREDQLAIEEALAGNRDALRQLVERHQPFVYNLALKMFGRREDAEDLAQEVFVKVITSLQTFRRDSAFRTWLYRITVNHFLNSRRRGMELVVDDFATYFDGIAAVATEDPPHGIGSSDETTEELRLRCTTGMLMCLDRAQRLAFLLGAMFGLPDRICSEILATTPGAFRVRLHRARRDLYSWMNQRCGLVNVANPCRCKKKTSGFIQLGLVDPSRLVFNADYVIRIADVTRSEAAHAMDVVDTLAEQVFTSHPLQLSSSTVVDEILGNATIRSFFAV
jgi:RNA polymerase sigma factor (sigma-70 family)